METNIKEIPVDSRVVQITAAHLEDGNRLFQDVLAELPYFDAHDETDLLSRDEFGVIAMLGWEIRNPIFSGPARVGRRIYERVTAVKTVEEALRILSKAKDPENYGWGIDIDPNKALDMSDGNAYPSYSTVGLWRARTDLPPIVQKKLGLIGDENE